MSREVASGLVGGLVGALAAKAIFKLPIPSSGEMVISPQTVNPGETKTLISGFYRFAVVLFHGDGDPEVTVDVKKDNVATQITANTPAIEIVASKTLEIKAINTSTESKSSPTIEIAWISW